MPIYAYRCTACGHAKDVLQKLSDPVLSNCPACGEATFAKQVTAAGFQLKGSGWYATDFKGSGAAPTKPAEGAAAAADEGKSDSAKTESKSDAKGDAKGDAKADAKPGSAAAPAAASPAAPAAPAAGPSAVGY